MIGGRTRPFVPAYIWGRHVIDTLLGVQRFDAQAAELESYGLKEVCQRLGLSEPELLYVEEIGAAVPKGISMWREGRKAYRGAAVR
ncbi:MAG TPA: hypothetical protein VMY87_06960 [Armatimonadota bacterium]|nr:hypothetical protein [Armatimonadota bacterium]